MRYRDTSDICCNRDGNDGPWSTFGMDLGSNTQQVRLLPATGQGAVWAVVPEGCTGQDPASCKDTRGGLYLRNTTSSWSQVGLYQLSLIEEQLLNYSGNGIYGTDKVGLAWPGDNLPSVPSQIIAGVATKVRIVFDSGIAVLTMYRTFIWVHFRSIHGQ